MSADPHLSVVIPVYNDPDGIRQTLRSLVDQRNPPSYEVRAVDNDSTDHTKETVEEFATDYPELVFSDSETDVQSSYAARNTGIEQASGEIIVFLDADETVGETYLRDVVRRFDESEVDYLGCNVQMYIPDGEDTIWARYDVAMGLPVEHYLRTKQFAPTCALVVRREVVEQVGLFDETLVSGGDKEFGNRVAREGFNMGYADNIVIRHPARTSFQSLVNKSKRIGKGQTQLWMKYDLATSPFNLGRVLPPSPKRVDERSDGSSSFLSILIIEYILKLVQTFSGISTLIYRRTD